MLLLGGAAALSANRRCSRPGGHVLSKQPAVAAATGGLPGRTTLSVNARSPRVGCSVASACEVPCGSSGATPVMRSLVGSPLRRPRQKAEGLPAIRGEWKRGVVARLVRG